MEFMAGKTNSAQIHNQMDHQCLEKPTLTWLSFMVYKRETVDWEKSEESNNLFLKIVDIFIFEGVGKGDLLPASRLATDWR